MVSNWIPPTTMETMRVNGVQFIMKGWILMKAGKRAAAGY